MIELILGIYTTVLYQPIYNLVVFLSVLSPEQNLGWAIVLLALIVRIAFFPLTLKGYQTDAKLEEASQQIKQIEDDINLDSKIKRTKITEIMKTRGINPVAEIVSLLGQLVFLAVLYQIVQQGLHPPYSHIYRFVPKPNDIQTVFFGMDISKSGNFFLSGVAGIILFAEQLWEYEVKKHIPEATFSGRWYPLLLPIATFILLLLLPATKAIFLAVSILFSIGVRLMYTLGRLGRKKDV